MSTRKKILVSVGILVGAVVAARVMIALRPEPPRLQPTPDTPLVSVAEARAGPGPMLVYGSGTVRPRAEVTVSPQVGGTIEWVSPHLQSGGRVSAGDLLARLEQADYVNRVEQARADVAAQEVEVLRAEEEARIAREEYRQFRSRENRRGAERPEPTPLTLREPQLEAARAQLDRARAQLADAELALRRTELRAPFHGRVRSETAAVGQFVAAGQSLGSIYAADAVEVVVPIRDDDAVLLPNLWALEAGDGDRSIPALVRTRLGQRRFEWDGYVDRAETALDEQSRTIDVVVRVPDPFRPGRAVQDSAQGASVPPLLVGQFADVEITGAAPRYFVLPRRALRRDDQVWSLDPDNRIRVVPVEVLQEVEESVYVSGDLQDRQRVVVAGVETVTEGMEVRTTETSEEIRPPPDSGGTEGEGR